MQQVILARGAQLGHKKLEAELDVKLVERGMAEVSAAPLGEAIMRQAQ